MTASSRSQVLLALTIVWAVVSVATLVVLAVPFLMPADAVHGLLPTCEWRVRYGVPCPACGLTTAFVALSAGDVTAARAAHPLGPVLYGMFLLNAALFLVASPRLSRRFLCK